MLVLLVRFPETVNQRVPAVGEGSARGGSRSAPRAAKMACMRRRWLFRLKSRWSGFRPHRVQPYYPLPLVMGKARTTIPTSRRATELQPAGSDLGAWYSSLAFSWRWSLDHLPGSVIGSSAPEIALRKTLNYSARRSSNISNAIHNRLLTFRRKASRKRRQSPVQGVWPSR